MFVYCHDPATVLSFTTLTNLPTVTKWGEEGGVRWLLGSLQLVQFFSPHPTPAQTISLISGTLDEFISTVWII